MHSASGRIGLTICLAALVMIASPSCSKEDRAQEPQGTAGSQIDVERVVELAKENVEKLRLSIPAARETQLEILGARPSPVTGLVELDVRVSREGRTAVRRLLISPDLKFVVRGLVVPVGKVPRVRIVMENVTLEGAATRGKADAPVTIVEYSDFQCPFCRQSQPMLERALREYEGKVKLVFKHLPLRGHAWALDAALLSECVRLQDPGPEVFWRLHDFYFDSGTALRQNTILEATVDFLKGEEIDGAKLTKCYQDQETADRVRQDMDESRVIGVKGTPAFLVNDVLLSGALAYDVLNAVIMEELGHDWLEDGMDLKKTS
jgi:protein-disulfide isomerase